MVNALVGTRLKHSELPYTMYGINIPSRHALVNMIDIEIFYQQIPANYGTLNKPLLFKIKGFETTGSLPKQFIKLIVLCPTIC